MSPKRRHLQKERSEKSYDGASNSKPNMSFTPNLLINPRKDEEYPFFLFFSDSDYDTVSKKLTLDHTCFSKISLTHRRKGYNASQTNALSVPKMYYETVYMEWFSTAAAGHSIIHSHALGKNPPFSICAATVTTRQIQLNQKYINPYLQ
ncbi:hypothetical protein CEXT_692691 [Caerostris extrusa]|uniref:Uncharacterized protein n=1 Tax=Caerostris extrusa TaxID=172846 RepID=A0AAV4QJP3_CAEEX|nr:hypothetical protein CEXT_692691 [Caerostris extrusa]